MKKYLNIFFVLSLFCLVFAFGGCSYTTDLSKNFSANGFYIKTTQDFHLVTTSDGIKLTSPGDNKISFEATTIWGQYDTGNAYYDIEDKTVSEYIQDMSKAEQITISNSIKNLTIKEKLSDTQSIDISLDMYIVCKNQNPNGNWDF